MKSKSNSNSNSNSKSNRNNDNRPAPFILISAGGTGGHMSPASSFATELIKRGLRVELATDMRGKKYAKMFPDIPVHILKSGTAHAGITGKIKGALNLAAGIINAIFLIRNLKPDAVVGFGGYPSVPALFAAQLQNIPTGLHEQNAIIGKANLFLAPKAKFIALSAPLPEGAKSDHIKEKTVITGNPVRPEIIALKDIIYPHISDENAPLNIFIMGGSLGANIFSSTVPKAMAGLEQKQKDRLNITQQCRSEDISKAKELYQKAQIKNVTLASFFDNVADQLSKAHLFIGRSGASTVAEISIAGRPAIYVPYPHHKDQQQKRNAQTIVQNGGAWLIEEKDFAPEKLLALVKSFFEDRQILPNAALRAKECGLPKAAQSLADITIEMLC